MIVSHAHLFCGMGGAAALGRHVRQTIQTAEGVERLELRCLGGIDYDPIAIALFGQLTGVRGTVLDLATRAGYCAFHGVESSPPGWREAEPADILAAFGGEYPDILVTSPPCQGASRLISEAKAAEPRYQALNDLSVRGIELSLLALADCPPKFVLLENVPGLAQGRGLHLLARIEELLADSGYATHPDVLDLGEVGGLSQTRRRFHLVARHRRQLPHHVHRPAMRRLRPLREVIERLPVPLPGCHELGRLHVMPRLKWETWLRLALIKPGSDWRHLRTYRVGDDGMLLDWRLEQLGPMTFRIVPAAAGGAALPGVAPEGLGWREDYQQYGVLGMEQAGGTVTGNRSPGGGPSSIADPRPADAGWHRGVLGVIPADQPFGTLTGRVQGASCGAHSIADPRVGDTRWNQSLGVVDGEQPASTVVAARDPGSSWAIADARLEGEAHSNRLQVCNGSEPGPTVIGRSMRCNATSIADMRLTRDAFKNHYSVDDVDGAASTVIGKIRPGGCASIADPRLGRDTAHKNHYSVKPLSQPSPTVIGMISPAGGCHSIADPRIDRQAHNNVMRVLDGADASCAITAGRTPTSGGLAVADYRMPQPGERLSDVVIISPWRTWSRPLTTLEAAALQSLVDLDAPGEFIAAVERAGVELGREIPVTALAQCIGNAIPSAAMAASAQQVIDACAKAAAGETFSLGSTPIWVEPEAPRMPEVAS